MPYLAGARQLPTLDAAPFALRSIRSEDAADLFEIFGDAETMRYWSSPPIEDLDAARDLVGEVHTAFHTRRLFQWGIVRHGTERVIGTGTLANLDEQNLRAEIGFALLRAEWGKGVMSRVLPALVRYAFEGLRLHRLEADVDPRNGGSSRLLEKIGFKREGCRRESYILNGEIQDAVVYGLLRTEFDPIP